MIVSTLLRLITEEVYLIKIILNELKAKCLVPSTWEHIKGNLTTNRVCQVVLIKLCLQNFDHLFADPSFLIVFLKVIPFRLAAISTDRRYIEHAVAKLHKGPALDRNVQVSNINENKVDKFFQLFFTEVIFKARCLEKNTRFESHETIFGEKEIVFFVS